MEHDEQICRSIGQHNEIVLRVEDTYGVGLKIPRFGKLSRFPEGTTNQRHLPELPPLHTTLSTTTRILRGVETNSLQTSRNHSRASYRCGTEHSMCSDGGLVLAKAAHLCRQGTGTKETWKPQFCYNMIRSPAISS